MRSRVSSVATRFLANLFLFCVPLISAGTLSAQVTDAELLEFTKSRSKQQRVTQFPVWMDYALQFACRRPKPPESEPEPPHVDKAIHVYCDEKNLPSMWDPYAKFAEGSIVLKEKFDPQNQSQIELFTGMLKREQGFNPEVGDWEFFTVSGDATQITSRGKLESCMNCHRDYPDSDFVTKSYAALAAGEKMPGILIGGQWQIRTEPVCNGSGEAIFLPASLAMTRGNRLTRTEAHRLYAQKAQESQKSTTDNSKRNSAEFPQVPEDLSSLGGPKLRYEPQLNKNTLGYWTEIDDSASWQIAFEKPGRYQVSVLQGCGTGNEGSQVIVSLANQQLEFTVVDTGGFQSFRWLKVGELEVVAAGQLELVVQPKSKAADAVMDLQQIRLDRSDIAQSRKE